MKKNHRQAEGCSQDPQSIRWANGANGDIGDGC